MKSVLLSVVLGLVLAIIPASIYANNPGCQPVIVFDGKICTLFPDGDGGCSGGVCVCAYNCG